MSIRSDPLFLFYWAVQKQRFLERCWPYLAFRPMPFQHAILSQRAKIRGLVGANRCLEVGTLVMTPEGPTPIERLSIGSTVYSEDGAPIKVAGVYNQGVQPVVDLVNRGTKVASCTVDHRWLTRRGGRYEGVVAPTGRIAGEAHIERREVICPLGPKSEPMAYVLGVLLGDGCCRENALTISSGDESVIRRVGELLGSPYRRGSAKNYSWYFPKKMKAKVTHYSEWLHNRYAHEKIVDMDVVRSWDRSSLLAFMAGLLDTDGSVHFSARKGEGLTIAFGMQARCVVEAFQYGLLALWGVQASIHEDRRERYKNGSVWTIAVRHFINSLRILRELSPYIQVERKRYDPLYERVGETCGRSNRFAVGIGDSAKGPTRQALCYDIHVASPTNLYLLANGLVTHNSGKTYAAATDCVQIALNVKHLLYPDGWEYIPGPKKVWAIALDANKARDTVIPKIKQALGTMTPYRWREADQEFHLPNGSVIAIKSQESGFTKAQSADIDHAWFDEQPEERYFREVMARLIDRNGTCTLSMTPVEGITWLYPTYVEPWLDATGGAWKVHNGTIFAGQTMDENPYLSKQAVEDYKKTIYDPREYGARVKGEWLFMEGLIYPNFQPKVHIIPSFEIPKDWRKVRCMDWGLKAPAACGWLAKDPVEGTLHLYRDWQCTELTIEQICRETILLSGQEAYECDLLDPACWNRSGVLVGMGDHISLASLYHQFGLPVVPGSRELIVRIQTIRRLLGNGSERPGLLIHDCCHNTIREIRRWKYKANSQKPEEGGDHSLDACVTGDTMVLTPNGEVPIRDLAAKGECEVIAFDEEKFLLVRARAFAFQTRASAKVIRVGPVRCTEDHPFLTLGADGKAWTKASELLLPSTNGLWYVLVHERPNRSEPELPSLGGEAVLPEREVLPCVGEAEARGRCATPTSSGCLGGGKWSGSIGLPHPPSGPRSSEQRPWESRVLVAHRARFGPSGEAEGHDAVALLPGGAPVAQEARGKGLQESALSSLAVRGLLQAVPRQKPHRQELLQCLQGATVEEGPSGLRSEVQEASIGSGGTQSDTVHRGEEEVGEEPVYNLSVERHHTFIANGVVVHNCGHGVMYFETEAGTGGPEWSQRSEEHFTDQPVIQAPPPPLMAVTRKVRHPDGSYHLQHAMERHDPSDGYLEEDGHYL